VRKAEPLLSTGIRLPDRKAKKGRRKKPRQPQRAKKLSPASCASGNAQREHAVVLPSSTNLSDWPF